MGNVKHIAGTMRGWRRMGAPVVAAAAVVSLLSAAGCGARGVPTKTLASTRAELSAASPAVRGSDNGLELSWWVVTSDSGALGAELRQWIDEPVPADPAILRTWAANGLRVVSIPIETLETLRARLPIVGAIQRQWLGQAPLWTDAVRGPYWARGATVGLDTGPLRLGPGRLRLLTRCWTVPVPPAPRPADQPGTPTLASEKPVVRAAMHIELVLQHQEAEANADDLDPLARPDARPGTEDEGLVFRRLLLTMEAPPGRAYLIIPESPTTSWRPDDAPHDSDPGPSEPAGAPPTRDGQPPSIGRVTRGAAADAPADQPASTPGALVPAGPPAPVLMSLGQAMLTSVGARGPRPVETTVPSRAIIILVPRVPTEFRLLR